jgi:hypothetical protein
MRKFTSEWAWGDPISDALFVVQALLVSWMWRLHRRVGWTDQRARVAARAAEKAEQLALATHVRIDAHQKALNLVYGDAWARARNEAGRDV